MEEELITITMQEYNDLMKDREFLDCLRTAGVDNWDGFSEAAEMFINNT